MIQSGVIPYEYVSPFPVRSDRIQPVGISGIVFELAQWVMNAELRRHISYLDFPDLGFTWDRYNVDGSSRQYEPTTSGFWLANRLDPALLTPVNYILQLRDAFYNLMVSGLVIHDCDYTVEEIRRDWLFNLYPNSPSGFRESPEINGDGNYFRGNPPNTGSIESCDIGILGTSGVLFDIDLAEVAYQPYPRIGRSLLTNAHKFKLRSSSESDFPIQGSPIFPCFQNTIGQTVSATTRDVHNFDRDITFSALRPTYNNLYSTDHVLSGVIRLDGDILLRNATYMIGTGGTHGREDFDIVSEMAFAASGLRALGQDPDDWPTLGSGVNSSYTRVYLIPSGSISSPVQSGIYRVGVSLPRASYPLSPVVSGIISCWPSGNPYILAPGYQVFDDCIWTTDYGETAFSGDEAPSGLVAISPFNGACLWVRHADLTQSSAVAPDLAPGNNWPEFVGLDTDGTFIYRARFVLNDEGGGASSARIMAYDRNLNFITEHTPSNVSFPNGALMDLTRAPGLNYAGNSLFIPMTDGEVLEVQDSFGLFHIFSGPPTIQARLAYFDGKFFGYGTDHYTSVSDRVFEMSFNTSSNTWSFAGVNYPIDTDSFAADVGTVVEIWDIINVTTGTHVNNGIWAIFTADTGFLENPIVCLGRIEFTTVPSSRYRVVELIKTYLKRNAGGPNVNLRGHWYDLVHMPIHTI